MRAFPVYILSGVLFFIGGVGWFVRGRAEFSISMFGISIMWFCFAIAGRNRRR